MPTIPPWSFSTLTSFETCPRKHFFTKVARTVKEPPTEHTIWGNKVHSALEHRVKDKTLLPPEMQKWEPLVRHFDSRGGVHVEKRVALSRDLHDTAWSDSWVRCIIDLCATAPKRALLLDWKTGKIKPSGQLSLSAAIWMAVHPWIERVDTAFVWLGFGKITPGVVLREATPAIWEDHIQRVRRMEAAYEKDRWVPRPSGLCNGWCPVGKANCEYWAPKRSK